MFGAHPRSSKKIPRLLRSAAALAFASLYLAGSLNAHAIMIDDTSLEDLLSDAQGAGVEMTYLGANKNTPDALFKTKKAVEKLLGTEVKLMVEKPSRIGTIDPKTGHFSSATYEERISEYRASLSPNPVISPELRERIDYIQGKPTPKTSGSNVDFLLHKYVRSNELEQCLSHCEVDFNTDYSKQMDCRVDCQRKYKRYKLPSAVSLSAERAQFFKRQSSWYGCAIYVTRRGDTGVSFLLVAH